MSTEDHVKIAQDILVQAFKTYENRIKGLIEKCNYLNDHIDRLNDKMDVVLAENVELDKRKEDAISTLEALLTAMNCHKEKMGADDLDDFIGDIQNALDDLKGVRL